MIKESVLFVASTALLVYFVSPVEKPEETGVAVEDPGKPVTDNSQDSDDAWGYDDPEVEDEGFVFGEPVIHSDAGYGDDAADRDEEESPVRATSPEDTARRAAPATRKRPQLSSSSPGPNEPGGMDNPIIFEARTPENPIDD